jgi:CheY-like chemotaxis protein
MPDGGTLTIESQNVSLDEDYVGTHMEATVGPHVLIAVSDTGHGMSPATMARVFEPFFTTKPAGRGTGLGLATVHGVVRQSGGTIWVYSEEGRGTTFKLYFPRTRQAVPEPVPSRPARAGRISATVVLVEDDPKLRAVARDALIRAGHHVLEAPSPLEAIRQVESHAGEIHLLLTDVVMPQMSGRQLAQRLTHLRPTLRVLFMSGYTENTIVHDGILDPDVAFLPKPITPARLVEKVDEVLAS